MASISREVDADNGMVNGARNAWPAAVVASVILVVIGGVAVASIFEYTADESIQIWSGLAGLLGLVTGTIATYFFTSTSVHNAEDRAGKADQRAERAADVADAANERAKEDRGSARTYQAAFTRVMGAMPPDQWRQLQDDPAVQRALLADR